MALSDIHIPVMLERCIELLAPAIGHEGAVVVDATLGMGGHTEVLLERFPSLRVVGLDRDTDALDIASRRLERFGDRLIPVHTVYDGIDEALEVAGVGEADGYLFDLGVSSFQLDEDGRGFSYSRNAPLDMRMDRTAELTAHEVVNGYDEHELRRIFYEYGEEKLAPRYARAIVSARRTAPIADSAALVDIIQNATPRAVQRAGHPAKRVFQAVRIEVNRELEVLETAIPLALERTVLGGRVVVMSYQSLEDRIVKRAFAAATASTGPRDLPVELPEHAPRFRALVRGAELADQDEQDRNPRSKPVRLRAVERVRKDRA
ncbi:16S rRNA (cytosine(1402)-N(4))-methyltransferase RsmH [Mycetocola reblochoni]|uniref:Ribosomal RNA small subunit methyltransferase H n=2 Tax=Mycetocola reblochoni TaxID=331618 RepID=A0A1R4J7K6_9MICO|nr:16S rRNA (cytosine(1402)-N(4))-methyltransferase RsmH [Mycetocola reblochoni]RLP69632.1 16S rRNA (cytosine(1402)-N(4))-methyltransferase RsmH [Mycetocola reblochoni]SJN27805.1 rRNA small subunit methyltransferase H [Mycetocola reblochoni REB411]